MHIEQPHAALFALNTARPKCRPRRLPNAPPAPSQIANGTTSPIAIEVVDPHEPTRRTTPRTSRPWSSSESQITLPRSTVHHTSRGGSPGTGSPQQSAAVRAGEASSSSRAKRPARRRFAHPSIILAALEQYEDSLLTPRGQSSPGPPTGFIEATLTAPLALIASLVCVRRSLPPPGRGRDGGRGRSEAVRAEQLWESGGRKIGSCCLLEREVSGKKRAGPG